ncbi:hypothetical protein IE81DRAFT_237460 [Ceraceosorus guamensis]|uniref:Uncharacterized protein n=1 Tax=Ceraceosorus guamensis TaxID=1522189 RepID=A0A316VRC5_9BASI|nr:hypothetical protein IE81DRAFT_237460 [Ceraceosorus guamensis]PWN40146.1 hypothetical protein IE81DRAFT_237460 [Ceraceosorus guamensis]
MQTTAAGYHTIERPILFTTSLLLHLLSLYISHQLNHRPRERGYLDERSGEGASAMRSVPFSGMLSSWRSQELMRRVTAVTSARVRMDVPDREPQLSLPNAGGAQPPP